MAFVNPSGGTDHYQNGMPQTEVVIPRSILDEVNFMASSCMSSDVELSVCHMGWVLMESPSL